ncbi:MAG TPA: hypothetical protein VMD30_10510 [Tepidisphaeraceae bacterium]|nr:hypothetical protein [Tepidisphaeraceae bacterium]
MCGTSFTRTASLVLLAILCVAAGCAEQSQPTATLKSYAFWPPFPDAPHILFLASYTLNTDVEPPRSQWQDLIYGSAAPETAMINHPYGVAMWHGRIYVCDTQSSLIEILDLRKHQMQVMGAVEAGKLEKPVAIAIADDGFKYVADDVVGVIDVFDPGDRMVAQIGHEHFRPVDVAVYGRLLYVTDFAANHVEVFDRFTGKTVRIIGGPGIKKGQFVGPLGLAVDLQGNIYVDEVVGCHVQKFSPQGKQIGQFGALGDIPGDFVRPKQIAVDSDGIIYVVDAAFSNVQMFDKSFHPLMYFGSAGEHPGAMDLPAGICVHEGDLDLFADRIPDAFQADRLVIVTNNFGDHKVSVYAEGHLKAGHSLSELSGLGADVPNQTTTTMSRGAGAPLSAEGAGGAK